MTWTTPPTFVSGAVLTAAQLNILRDDLNESAAAKTGAAGGIYVPSGVNQLSVRSVTEDLMDGSGTVTSTSYADLGPGPAVAVTTGTKALVIISAFMQQSGAASCQIAYEVAGATAIAASDNRAARFNAAAASDFSRHSAITLETALTAGVNSFTMKYRVSGGTGTFANRRLAVIPFS